MIWPFRLKKTVTKKAIVGGRSQAKSEALPDRSTRNIGEKKTYFQRGNRALVSKKYEEAIELFLKHADRSEEDYAKSHIQIAKCYLQTNILKSPVEYSGGAAKLIFQGDRKNAVAHYRLALDKDPNHGPALYKLSMLLAPESEERYDLLERAVEHGTTYLGVLEFGDLLRTVRKDFEAAYMTYKRAIELQPNEVTAYVKIQDMCRRLDRPSEAKERSQKWKALRKAKKERFR